jgi:hypothetical protein
MPARVAVLFPNAWDLRQLALPKYQGVCEFVYQGDDLFSFPGSLQLLTFDALRFIDRTVAWCREQRVDGVMSTDEYIGAIIAAEVARRLGLPANDPVRIIGAQHKYYSRVVQAKVVPEITPPHAIVPLNALDGDSPPLPYPFFTKPCKGTFSLFASRIGSREDFATKLRFNLFERLLLNRVARPFNDLLRALTDFEHDASAFVAEGLMQGDQVTVDGFVFQGEVSLMGIVDSVMFEGTQTFERFEYPSRLQPRVQERMLDVTKRVVEGLGFLNGQFNVELFYDRRSDAITVIECNPRLSYQFADLYEYVDGSNTYDVLLDLTLGRPPSFARRAGEFRVSSSFVLRTFEGKKLTRVPSPQEVEAFRRDYDEATIKIYGKAGTSMKGEIRASGSYRCAIINVAAQSYLDLFAIHQDGIDKLPFGFK